MPLQITHRPDNLKDFFGNQPIKDSLESIFARSKDYPHAFLFSGPTGCGKTTLARIVGNLLGCDAPEELNMSNLRGIDSVRTITETCIYKPLFGKTKFYIIDEVHRQTKDAQNAFLKLLEDPPSHVYFALCTTEPEKLLPTITGRCHCYTVKTLKTVEMTALLKSVLEKEHLSDYPDKLIQEIVVLSEGLPRNALKLLDSVIDIEEEDKALAALNTITFIEADTKALCQALVKGDTWKNWKKKVKDILTEVEPESLRYAILGYLGAVLFNQDKPTRIQAMIDIFSENTYSTGKVGLANQICYAFDAK